MKTLIAAITLMALLGQASLANGTLKVRSKNLTNSGVLRAALQPTCNIREMGPHEGELRMPLAPMPKTERAPNLVVRTGNSAIVLDDPSKPGHAKISFRLNLDGSACQSSILSLNACEAFKANPTSRVAAGFCAAAVTHAVTNCVEVSVEVSRRDVVQSLLDDSVACPAPGRVHAPVTFCPLDDK